MNHLIKYRFGLWHTHKVIYQYEKKNSENHTLVIHGDVFYSRQAAALILDSVLSETTHK